ncbi:hypothetical protein E2C01_029082 [Portunus trituberculatus]|uniref:Uncharacterized protein n=1 Tax=Portunus trituberculatus TaxID=210409 RepID=A0A5B7EQJ7_PORTR|nr:hypothetical protein [Portunus trituberculatus]
MWFVDGGSPVCPNGKAPQTSCPRVPAWNLAEGKITEVSERSSSLSSSAPETRLPASLSHLMVSSPGLSVDSVARRMVRRALLEEAPLSSHTPSDISGPPRRGLETVGREIQRLVFVRGLLWGLQQRRQRAEEAPRLQELEAVPRTFLGFILVRVSEVGGHWLSYPLN